MFETLLSLANRKAAHRMGCPLFPSGLEGRIVGDSSPAASDPKHKDFALPWQGVFLSESLHNLSPFAHLTMGQVGSWKSGSDKQNEGPLVTPA